MIRTLAAVLLLGLFPGLTPAIEIKNVRSSYGPLGPTRTSTKFLPGDELFMTYDIHALAVDAKTGKAVYETRLELLDDKQKLLFERKTPNEVVPNLGGARMPGDLYLTIGTDFDPGRYTVKLTITDKLAKQSKAIVYAIEVLPRGFGFIGVRAPALGLTAQAYHGIWHLVGFAPEGKKKLPNVDITIRLLDESDKLVVPETKIMLPAALPVDTDKPEFVPVSFPLYLNRPGQFHIEITAVDKNASNAQIQMRIPLNVLEIGAITGERSK